MTTESDTDIIESKLYLDITMVLDPSVAMSLIKGLLPRRVQVELDISKPLTEAFIWSETRQGEHWWELLDDAIIDYTNG